MSSTRSINTPGNYMLAEQQFRKTEQYKSFINSSSGQPHSISIPAGGSAPPSKMNRESLSNNSVDIESSLFGIGSTNLVYPLPPVIPQLKSLNTATFFIRPALIIPSSLVIQGNQRPFPNINS